MARKSLAEDLFDMLTKAPWWLGVAGAAVFWIVGMIVIPAPSKDVFQTGLRPLLKFLFNGMAILCLVAAAVSGVKQLMRRRLLDNQSGLDSLRSLSWQAFEQLVGEAYRRQGYDVEETGQGGADGGVDLVLRGNGETVLVQCKQWRVQQVGVDKVRELFGVLNAEGANRGILVTSGTFTNEAKSFKVGKPLTLVDGPALANLVREVRTRPPPAGNQEPRTTNQEPTCPLCNAPMVLRTAKRGATAGKLFYGCTQFSKTGCRGTRDT